MDFGLWVEPEMVNPDSDLYRAHPDWVLHHGAHERPLQRRQLALDLARPEVRAHLLDRLDVLLRTNRIAYLKWDHNRDLFPAHSHDGSSAHGQTIGFYDVLDRLRAAHPHVEIESCASGGGRMDFGVLPRVSRFWVSDNTDAVERWRIQSDVSLFLPLNRIGSHVGASPNPSTGRQLSMLLRARVAMFAHMGVEADPTKLSAEDAEILAQHIALYKEYRGLIHEGAFASYAGDDPDVRVWMCVARDKSQALGMAARGEQARGLISQPVRLMGLDRAAHYSVELLRPWPAPARFSLPHADSWRAEPQVFSGELLEMAGLLLPLVHPETCWLWRLTRVETASQ
jgi:alpha-galactosidase